MANNVTLTVTIEAGLMRDARAVVDAMDAKLRTCGGRVVTATLTQGQRDRIAVRVERKPKPTTDQLARVLEFVLRTHGGAS